MGAIDEPLDSDPVHLKIKKQTNLTRQLKNTGQGSILCISSQDLSYTRSILLMFPKVNLMTDLTLDLRGSEIRSDAVSRRNAVTDSAVYLAKVQSY